MVTLVMSLLMVILVEMSLPKIPRMSEHQSVLMLVNKGLGEYNLGWCVRQICIFADYHFDQIVLTY